MSSNTEFTCPLTGKLFEDPVKGSNGKTYERSVLQNLIDQGISPIRILETDYQMLGRVTEFKRKHNVTQSHYYNSNTSKMAVTEPDEDDEIIEVVSTQVVSTVPSMNNHMATLYQKYSSTNINSSKLKVSSSTIVIKPAVIKTPNFLAIALNAVSEPTRLPIDLCVCMDVSGSMNDATYIKSEGKDVCDGYTKMDLAKYAMNIIVEVLTDYDYLTIVAFGCSGQSVKEIFRRTKMDCSGKESARSIISRIQPQGCTPMYEALDVAIKTRRDVDTNISSHIILLTDGIADYDSRKSEIISNISGNKNLTTVNTLGFGNDVNAENLLEVAEAGGGMYIFIPDASFVINVLTRQLSNIFLTCGINASGTVNFRNGRTQTINLGNVRFGTIRCVAIKTTSDVQQSNSVSVWNNLSSQPSSSGLLTVFVENNSLATVVDDVESIVFVHNNSITHERKSEMVYCSSFANAQDDTLITYIVRDEFSVVLRKESIDALNKFKEDLRNIISKFPKSKYLMDLLTEANGEATTALQTYRNTWGLRYLKSLLLAHKTQTCVNFIDPAVQHYSNDYLEYLIKDIEEKVSKIALPNRSKAQKATRQAPTTYADYTQSYNNPNSTCFLGSCKISTFGVNSNTGAEINFGGIPNGEKLVQDLQVGDLVLTPKGPTKVTHIIKTLLNGQTAFRKHPDGLTITGWHPVKCDGENWTFPIDNQLFEHYTTNASEYYCLALENHHIAIVNGVQVICLGHSYTEGVLSHPYFGSRKVIDDLNKLNTNVDGYVTIDPQIHEFKRDENGFVCTITEK